MPKVKPRVYLDVSIGGRGGGRIVFELFYDLTPRTAENFRGLCTGEYGVGRTTKKALCYEGCSFFRSNQQVLQSGDFQFNTGDGGESIYGGTFNDEDFSRRHTQPGILSMANKGRNSNGSQFFITLKRNARLDGRNLVVGQVVDGMDVIRAIGKVPTDRDEKPRVPIMIVGSGELGTKKANQADPSEMMSKQIAKLNEEAAPTEVSVNAAEKAKAILKGAQGGAAVEEEAGSSSTKQTREDAESGAMAPPRNERERKLFELRLRMNQGRTKNSKEVVEEQKRNSDPDYARKQAFTRQKQREEEEKKLAEEKGEPEDPSAKPGAVPKGKDYMNDTLEQVEMREAKKGKKNPGTFGWDVFNQDSLYNAHNKRLKHIGFDEKGYKEQQLALEPGQSASMVDGFGFVPTAEAKDRLRDAMDTMLAKKGEHSRRRMFIADEDATYVNERNRHFNKKLQRAFGAYTEETRQNLERGTAL